jgi:hypothetical protein
MMDIIEATGNYEQWVGKRIRLIRADLQQKHARMAEDTFSFLRATFYRWAQLWPQVCEKCAGAPKVLAVGDLHVENFGTWRDSEGRLLWGINDFDEAYELPYTFDLVRLAASAYLAIDRAHLRIKHTEASDFILQGYQKGMSTGGAPWVLEEHHPHLRAMMTGILRNPEQFWAKLDSLPTWKKPVPDDAKRAMECLLPAKRLPYRIVHRIAGLGSLGRERYVAIADYCGGKVAREAKALAPSACVWAETGAQSARIRYQEILDESVRSLDPFVHMKGRWIVRRLAPHCSRVELASLPQERDEIKLMYAMGFETANVHLGTRKAVKKIGMDLMNRPQEWLHLAATNMAIATIKDWEQWRGNSK